MSLAKMRALLYRTSRWVGDLEAVRRNRVGRRIVRRAGGKGAGHALRMLFG